jgi:serine/threonine protein kinase
MCPVQRFCREVMIWKTLRHPNVLPLLGVTMTKDRFVAVSEWMENGSIDEFVKANVYADRLGLVCFSFRVLTFFICH